jgi:hypothetical protein
MDFKVQNSLVASGLITDAAMLPIYDAAYLQGNMINPNVSSLQDGNYLVYDGINKIWTYGNGPTGPVSVFGTNFGEYLYWNSYTGLNGAWSVGSKNITLGYQAGYTGQGTGSVAIGNNAGSSIQGTDSVAIGNNTGQQSQRSNAVAIGNRAGNDRQGTGAIAIGNLAGSNIQGTNAVAIGNLAGATGQGTGSISIGFQASNPNQVSNSTIINSSGIPITGATGGFYIAPVRNSTGPSLLYYNNSTKEITHNGSSPQFDNLYIGGGSPLTLYKQATTQLVYYKATEVGFIIPGPPGVVITDPVVGNPLPLAPDGTGTTTINYVIVGGSVNLDLTYSTGFWTSSGIIAWDGNSGSTTLPQEIRPARNKSFPIIIYRGGTIQTGLMIVNSSGGGIIKPFTSYFSGGMDNGFIDTSVCYNLL